jgi:hypothetical protein
MDKLHVFCLSIDPMRFRRTQAELSRVNVVVELFPGVSEDSIETNDSILPSVKMFVPWKTIAISLAHQLVAREVLRRGYKDALILEDDVKIINVESFHSRLKQIRERNGDKHMTRLFWMSWGMGSSAAFILTESGARRIVSQAPRWHIDAQQSLDLDFACAGPLFSTYDDYTGILPGGMSLSFWESQPNWRCGPLGTICHGGVILLAIMSLLLAIKYPAIGAAMLTLIFMQPCYMVLTSRSSLRLLGGGVLCFLCAPECQFKWALATLLIFAMLNLAAEERGALSDAGDP